MRDLFKKIKNLFKELMFFTTSYSINVFPEHLSQEEEAKHLIKAKNGDKNSRSILIEHNLRLVAHIVKKYELYKEDQDDLISIGTIGLIKGIDSYNIDKKIKLTTYIAKCIENEILMYIRSNKKNINVLSLNDSIGKDKDGNEINLIDVLEEDNKDMLDSIYLKDNVKLLQKYIGVLNERELKIITYRYGLFNNDEYTQKEISKMFHISRSYVSRIEKRALIKMLREFIRNE